MPQKSLKIIKNRYVGGRKVVAVWHQILKKYGFVKPKNAILRQKMKFGVNLLFLTNFYGLKKAR